MENILHILYTAVITTIVWFLVGGVLYMNPLVAKIYQQYADHPSMKKWPTHGQYFTGVFFVSGFIPILLITMAYAYIGPLNFIILGLILSGVRIIPRLCDMWMQTSYPNRLLQIELVNGVILSFVIAYVFTL
ncbi:hypothetical protein KJ761_01435 [Patescibacteria group bacterium]|nr:hypothetical protein [Patescibacteria group bacterium]